MSKNVGFIGVGYMGYGIAKNLLKNNFNLKIIAHKKRKPIERLVSEGGGISSNEELSLSLFIAQEN